MALFRKLSDKAKTPTKGTTFSAGYDLFAPEDTFINANSRKIVPTDIAMSIPQNHFGLIAARSSRAVNSVDTGGGIIDSDFCGNIGVILVNNNPSPLFIKQGEKLAQLLLIPIYQGTLTEVDVLPPTERGDKGWGSTGK